ncbi:MAG: glycosyltransferase family 2 protein [Candidatus Taylorbacteria bacterium]|nr:glycosyltransferase family 2 protein [Candidatus Taylorbacteria bacterium]
MQKIISIIVPVHNEEKNIPLIKAELSDVLAALPYSHEIIFVNDGSTDNSEQIIESLTKSDARIKSIEFSRNFGHQAAIEAGIKYSTGDAVIMMDGDFQHPPQIIPKLIEKWIGGYDVVNSKRIDNKDISFFKRITSTIFYKLLNSISDIKLESGSADFRLLDKKVIDELKLLTEKQKFYRGLVMWVGFRSTIVEYEVCKRLHGKSSYTFKKMLTLAREGLTSFSMLPMKFIFLIGILLLTAGTFSLSLMLFIKYFIDYDYFSGSAILAMFIVVNNGFVILLMGIISLYQITMFKEIQNRPNFIIKNKSNF